MAAAQVVAGAGALALPGRRLLEATGADRIGYLHRMLTQDVAGLGPDHGAAACYLTATGRVLAHLLLWRRLEGGVDRLWLDVAAGASPEALPLLERYVIADDVAFLDRSGAFARLVLVATDPAPPLAAAGLPEAREPGRIVAFDAGGDPDPAQRGFLLPLGFGRRSAVHVLCPAARAEAVLARLVGAGAAAWTPADLDRARVEEGVPWAGAEIDERILPNEARLDDAVSFTKGCYPGQEPVIMARHRGHPSTLLVRLVLDHAPGAAAGTALLEGERTVGRLTTVVHESAGHALALGFVRHALAQPGRVVTVAGGGRAEVV